MPSIVHLGLGNFHRAHQAWYTHVANGQTDKNWTITGISLRSSRMRDTLAPQGFDYTLAIRDAQGESLNRITCIDDILFAPADPAKVLQTLCEADLITLTITEKGYCLGPDGKLDLSHSDIERDLAGGMVTPIALLAHALHLRTRSVTILSCDNLSNNGALLESAVSAFAAARGIPARDGVTHHFPSTMVDRITPATSDALIAHVASQGFVCAAPVETEVFSEWVIEDFDAPRPAWELAGAQFVGDVTPFEHRKLRMLNGAHSMLAYAGLNRGVEFVHQAIADPELRAMAEGVLGEAAATLPKSLPTADYAASLIERFSNPALHHSLRQIAMDGSLKLPVRLIATMTDAAQPVPHCAAAIAEWIRFAMAETSAGRVLDDPNAEQIGEASLSDDPVPALLDVLGTPEDLLAPYPEAFRHFAG